MIAKNLYKYANETFDKHLCSITELSKRDNGKSLVKSKKELYNFDAISKTLYSSDKCPASADCLCVTKTTVHLIEFKAGFKKKITKENLDKKKAICKHIGIPCDDYWDIFFKNQDKETKELITSIRFKAMESYLTIEKQILPHCEELMSDQKKMQIKLIIVIDEDGIDSMEDTLAEFSKRTTKSNNCFAQINASLKRMKKQQDAQGNDYFYDDIDVISGKDFYYLIENV